MNAANSHSDIDRSRAVAAELLRPNTIRDASAAVFVLLGLLLPWNIYFGTTVAGSSGSALTLLVLVSLLALGAVTVAHTGPQNIRLAGADVAAVNRLRVGLATPYLLLVLCVTGFAIVQSIRAGGNTTVPPGVGPGAWFGLAGALLAAQPVLTDAEEQAVRGARIVKIIGGASLALAVASALFNLYWRTRFVIPKIGDEEVGTQSAVVAVTAVLYAAVALIPVLIAARWAWVFRGPDRLALVLLAASTLLAGLIVWVFPVGRDLDAFHGIAQNTSTAGVGFEGYLAWAAVAGIVGAATLVLAMKRGSAGIWRASSRKCLLLIAAWCGGTATLRIVDLMTSSVLDLPAPPYNGTALMAFDLATALLAMWLYINTATAAKSRLAQAALYGLLVALTLSRVVLGVALVPRSDPLNPTDITDVYGNTLVQQITSAFDVGLCALGFVLLGIVLWVSAERPTAGVAAARPTSAGPVAKPAVATTRPPAEDPTTDLASSRGAAPTIAMPSAESAPTIAMAKAVGGRHETPTPADRVSAVLAESTQRFAAGTTYGGGSSAGSASLGEGERQTES